MASLMDWLKGFLASLTSTELSDSLNTIGVKGYEAGRKAGFEDTSENTQGEEPDEEPSKTDTDAINSIGVRTHALSEKTISEAKGSLAVEVDKLYKEMDAAMKAGMSEKEALISIQARMKGLFNECFPEWKIERLVRDQFIVATKEGRRSAWQDSGVKYRQWIMHLDSHTGEDSKRMNGQIAKIDEPYIDPLTGDKYMIPQIRPNDRCYEKPLYELPEETTEKDGILYAKYTISDLLKYSLDDPYFYKGGPGSGIKGHRTYRTDTLSHGNAEHMIVVDENGKVIGTQTGDLDSGDVGLPKEGKEAYYDPKRKLELHHNHPAPLGGSLSLPDILNTCDRPGIKTVWAHAPEGSYKMTIKDGTDRSAMYKDARKIEGDLMSKVKDKMLDMLDEGASKEAARAFRDKGEAEVKRRVLFALEKKGYIEYEEHLKTDITKGGVGSGIKGHTTPKKLTPKERKIVTAYQEGVKKLVGDFQSQKKTGKKAVDELRKEFKEKYTQHQQASIKAFTEEHQKTREAAKGRKQARAQKKESPVETKESSKQSDEEQKAKRKARREARKKRQEENLKKEREEAERKAKEEDEKKKKAQEKPEKKEKPKKETKKEKELREWKEERAKELERRREVRSKIFEDDVSKAHNSIMKDPKVTDFLKKTEGMSIGEAVKHLDSSQFLGVHLKDWQEGRYNTMDFMATKVFGLDEGNLRNETQDDMKYYRSSHEQIVGIAGTSLKQYYALTQRFLKEKYPSGYISVYRGVNGNTYNTFQEQGIKEGDDVKLASFNLNSWSLNKDIAQRFANKTKAGIVVETKIPIERVLMHHEILEKHAANPSYGDEKEILILGGGVNAKLSNYGTNPTAPDKEEDFY